VFVGAYGGLRIGELAGLRRSRVDLDAGTVDVAENLTEVQGKLHSGPPKTRASRRRVSLPGSVVQELAVHLGPAGRPTDYVFRAPAGGPLRINGFRYRVWRPAVMAAGLPGLRIHDLRHTAVALWIAAGPLPRRSPPEPVTRPSALSSTATATCSPRRMRRYATAWTRCFVQR
jgi:integrase